MLFPSLLLAFSLLFSLTAAQPLPRDAVIQEDPTILRERVAARQFSARGPSRKRDTSSPQPSPQYCPDLVNYEIGMLHITSLLTFAHMSVQQLVHAAY